MKVFNLRCGARHAFEGWFASEDDFAAQAAGGRIGCPLCGDTEVQRTPSAPRLNLSTPGAVPDAVPAETQARVRIQAHWLRAMRRVVDGTEDVGERFADEARRIHYGEAERRGIRGRASPEEAGALIEEGIEVLPLPEVLKGTLQ